MGKTIGRHKYGYNKSFERIIPLFRRLLYKNLTGKNR